MYPIYFLIGILFFIPTILFGQDSIPYPTLKKSLEQYGIYDKDLLPPEFHESRREALRNLMPVNSLAVFFSNPIRNRSNDVDFEYHQDPNFYYLTGLNEPHAVVLIFKEAHKINGVMTDEIIFVQPRNARQETWVGKRFGTEGVKNVLKIDQAFSNQAFGRFNFRPSRMDHIYSITPKDDARDNPKDGGDLASLVKHFRKKTANLNVASQPLETWMASLREIKTKEEIYLLRKAIKLTCRAQIEIIKAVEPGWNEYQSEALVEYFFKSGGAEYTGFPSICGGGENSCILHYTSNRKPLIGSNMLVVDVGAEYHGYTADITRTIPIDGTFSPQEAAIYNLVKKAQQAGIDVALAGNKFWDPNTAATEIIANGLLELGVIDNRNDVRKYFIHGTSHYLGLDVHDPGLYAELKPGSVITVEPGIYIPEGSDCDKKWWNIGVRIEDDILITKDGPENLSESIPRDIPTIERLMKEESFFNLIQMEMPHIPQNNLPQQDHHHGHHHHKHHQHEHHDE